MIIDVESYAMRGALERLIEQLPNKGEGLVIAAFYLGANSTVATVMHDGEAIYERDQPFGGQQLTSDIARAYGISVDDAEQKKRSGDLPADYETAVLKPFIDTAGTEITRALQFFFMSTPYSRVDQIMLAGGSAVISGLADALMERSQVPTSVISHVQGNGSVTEHPRQAIAPGRPGAPDAVRTGDAEVRLCTGWNSTQPDHHHTQPTQFRRRRKGQISHWRCFHGTPTG